MHSFRHRHAFLNEINKQYPKSAKCTPVYFYCDCNYNYVVMRGLTLPLKIMLTAQWKIQSRIM